jgi:hypothetical protein
MNPEVKVVIKEIADELGLKISDVERVYEAPFDLQAIIMKYRCDREKQIFPSLRVPYFLVFHCPDWHKARLQKKKEENEAV